MSFKLSFFFELVKFENNKSEKTWRSWIFRHVFVWCGTKRMHFLDLVYSGCASSLECLAGISRSPTRADLFLDTFQRYFRCPSIKRGFIFLSFVGGFPSRRAPWYTHRKRIRIITCVFIHLFQSCTLWFLKWQLGKVFIMSLKLSNLEQNRHALLHRNLIFVIIPDIQLNRVIFVMLLVCPFEA